jgi:phosphohistidine phosphatase SixA
MVTITAKSQADTSKKITRTLYVSPKASLINNLQKGGYVLSFRHGNASTGADQTSLALTTNWWISCLSTQARQLDSPSGFVQIQSTGQAIRNLKIGVSKIISSEYCRCKQSAENLNFKNLTIELNKDITFYVYDEPNRYAKTMNLIAAQSITNKNIVIVTHAGFSGTLPNPAPLNSLNWGDAAVFKLQAGVAPQFIDVITTQEWVSLK